MIAVEKNKKLRFREKKLKGEYKISGQLHKKTREKAL